MADQTVAVLGLGNMGAALARALKEGGYNVTAWNRSYRGVLATDLGISLAPDLTSAIKSSQTIISCLSNYAITRGVLEPHQEADALRGKSLIQLSTGLPAEASAMAAWARAKEIQYLDGKIAVVPKSIGLESTVIFYAGDRTVFEDHLPILGKLGGRPTFVGTEAEASSIADFGFLCFFFLSTIGLLYGSAFCQAAGLDEQRFLTLVPHFQKDISGRLPAFQKAIASDDFVNEIQSTLDVGLNGAELLTATARRLGLVPEPAEFIATCFRRAVERGFGGMDTGALVKIFRDCSLAGQS